MTKKLLTFLTLLTLFFGVGWAETKTDVLTRPITGINNNGGYSTWTYPNTNNPTTPSGAAYSGYSAGGNNVIQLNYNKTGYGIVSTTSAGKATKVTVVWNSNTVNGRTLQVYGSNTAYSGTSDLYGDNKGTLLGTIKYGTSTELTITGNYPYIGLVSESGAMYLTSISITWETGGTTPSTYSLTLPTGLTGGSVTATGDGVTDLSAIPSGTEMTVRATPSTGYELNWMKANGIEVDNPYIFNINANTTITADFYEQPSGNYYQKVTNSADITSGEYLIVYEDGNLAFNGGLSALDATGNSISVTIQNNKIYSSTTVDAATFTYDATAHTLKSASGFYIGRTQNDNGFNSSTTEGYTNTLSIEDGHAVITSSAGPKLQYFLSGANSRFRYYKTNQKPIQLYKKVIVGGHAVTVTQPQEGGEISADCETASAGTTVKLTATPAAGYNFGSWSVFKTGDQSTTVMVNNNQFTMPDYDVTVTATFTAKPTHSITVTGNTGSADPASAYEGQTVTLTPTIPEGKVVDWDNTTVTPSTVEINHSDYTFTMPDADVTVTFAFKDKPNTSEATYIFNTDEGLQNLGINKPNSGEDTNLGTVTFTVEDVTLSSTDGGTPTRVHNTNGSTDLRVYKNGGSIKLEVPEGSTITQVVFTSPDGDNQANSTNFSVDNGTMGTNIWDATSDVSSVTFTANNQVRIYTIKVAYIKGETPVVPDLYIIGNVNGIDVDRWHANQGVKMTHSNGVYTADIWVTGKLNDDMHKNAGTFAFFTVLAENNDDGSWSYVNGNRYEPDVRNINNPEQQIGDGHWWLANDENSVNTNVTLLNRNWNDDFLIPAGLYTVTVSEDLTKFNLTVIKDITPTITPDAGEVAAGTNATIALSEDFNTFIANCPKVLECTHGDNGSVYTPLNLPLPEVKLYVNNSAVEGISSEYTFTADQSPVTITGKGALLLNGNEVASKTTSNEYTVYSTYTATIASDIDGGTVAFNAAGTSTTLSGQRENNEIRVYVSPQTADYELETLTYKVGENEAVSFMDSYNTEGEYYYFAMPAGDVTISATFTWNGGEITETTYELVRSNDEIEVGKKYIIVNENASRALGISGLSSDVALPITITNNQTTITSDSPVSQFLLGSYKNAYTFKNIKTNKYLDNPSVTGSGSINQNGGMNDNPDLSDNIDWSIVISSNGSTVEFQNGGTFNYLLYFDGSQNKDFRAYSNQTPNNSSHSVQLYKESTPPTSISLADLCRTAPVNNEPIGEVGKRYTISDQLIAVHLVGATQSNPYYYLWCKDQGNASICPTEAKPVEGVMQTDYMKDVLKAQSGDWDQSNWVVLKFDPATQADLNSITGAVNHYINASSITGTYTDNANYTITMPEGEGLVGKVGDALSTPYVPNVYCTANFLDANLNINGGNGPVGEASGKHYFFMNPKVQEVANVTQAVWNGTDFVIAKKEAGNNAANFDGAFSVDWTYNSEGDVSNSLKVGYIYKFKAVLNIVPSTSKAPMRDGEGEEEPTTVTPKPNMTPDPGKKVQALDLKGDANVITAVTDVAGKTVAGVKYYNLAGMASDKPFDGVNIIVTTYTDGSRSSAKVLR